jgi:hypothetical protein
MRVLAAAADEGVDCDENGEDCSESGLHDNENNASDGLCCLGKTEFFDEDKDASNGQNADDLDGDVDSH